MTVGHLKKLRFIFKENIKLTKKYISNTNILDKNIFIITSFNEENYIIIKKYNFKGKKGLWLIFEKMSEEDYKKFQQLPKNVLDSQLKDFIKTELKEGKETPVIKEVKNYFTLFNEDKKGLIRKPDNIAKIVILPSLIEIFYDKK